MNKKFQKMTLHVAYDEKGVDGLDAILEHLIEAEEYGVLLLGWEASEMSLVDKENK